MNNTLRTINATFAALIVAAWICWYFLFVQPLASEDLSGVSVSIVNIALLFLIPLISGVLSMCLLFGSIQMFKSTSNRALPVFFIAVALAGLFGSIRFVLAFI